eukprot:scaffold215_cov389-Pavlova_lutheri.AAC.11
MEKQAKRNAEAEVASGRGGCVVHTDLEEGVRRLVDFRDGLRQQRSIAKEQRNTKLARLDEDAKEALKKSMETHGKRARRASSDRQSHGSGGGRSSSTQLEAGMRDTNNLLMLAMEEHVETQVEMARMKVDKFYKMHSRVAPDPGPKEVWIAR